MNNDENTGREHDVPKESNIPQNTERQRINNDLEMFEDYDERWSRAVKNRADYYKSTKKEGFFYKIGQKRYKKRMEKLEEEKKAEHIDFEDVNNELTYNINKSVRGLRRRKMMHHDIGGSCLTAVLYAAFILGVSMFCAGFIIMCANEVFAFVKPDTTGIVEIDEKDSYAVVSKKLENAKLIDHPWLFRLYCNVSNPKFRTGKFEINANLDYNAIKKTLTHVSVYRETVWVTIPEGYTSRQIAEALEEKKVCTAADFIKTADEGQFDYSFLPEKDSNVKCRLEGYLFPDTYQFYVDDDPENVIKKFLNNFSVRFTDKLSRRTQELEMTVDEVMTIASMVEREVKLDYERPIVASVIMNRLASPASFPYLQIDATVQYIIGRAPTGEDLEIDDPYNTYINKGLPPGAICNPGIDAVTAVLYPENTSDYYYVACANGTHIFSQTYEQHQAAIIEARATFDVGEDE